MLPRITLFSGLDLSFLKTAFLSVKTSEAMARWRDLGDFRLRCASDPLTRFRGEEDQGGSEEEARGSLKEDERTKMRWRRWSVESADGSLLAIHMRPSPTLMATSLRRPFYPIRMGTGFLWATAEDLAKNRGRVLSLYRQLLRCLNSPELPLTHAARLAKKAEVRSIFLFGAEERSLHNIAELIDTANYSISILKKGRLP
ncbi:hypothetical protein ZIOFF_007248 [Zingiber officinale]|uniref:LYR motif containing domain-containing protein n=2 Tax=Zingiber officinale TaxID=94328 RepID=A0A8J5M3F0_ZINOF|nr:hypothetical protein ZIOFF_007248 [Zingiber officinale]